jgi:hypothetical protein
MKTTSHNPTFGRLIAACSFLACAAAVQAQSSPPAAPVKVVANVERVLSHLVQIGIKPGSIHKIGVGLGVAKFRVIQIGQGGWISVECLEDNKAGWVPGEKYWVNTNTAVFISAPFVSSTDPPLNPASKAPAKTKAR